MRPPVVLIALAACHASSGTTSVVEFQQPTDFAHRIHRFRVRTGEADAFWTNNPVVKPSMGDAVVDVTTYEDGAPEAIKRVLEAKGYEAVFIWNDPWTYGSMRIKPKADDFRGYPLQITNFNLWPALGEDEAFLEVVTSSSEQTWTTRQTYDTEQEVGRVTDASGNTQARIYANGTETDSTTHTKKTAIAAAQLFVAGQAHPIFYRQTWTHTSSEVAPVIEKALAAIPDRAK